MSKPITSQDHSSAWIIQTWASFIISVTAMSLGIIYLPVENWTKGYMGMGLVFTVGSTMSLAKTTRDIHEGKKMVSKVEEARVEKLLNEHSSLR